MEEDLNYKLYTYMPNIPIERDRFLRGQVWKKK